jgi:hypothetical protein
MTYYPVNLALNRRSGSNRTSRGDFKTDRYKNIARIIRHPGEGRDLTLAP